MSDLLHCTAVFGEGGRYRYSLSREWDLRAQQLCWIMLNPSKASADRDDPTIRRCVGFARRWGYGGIVVVNLFAYVATYPAELLRASDPVGPFNDDTINQATANRRVVCAWGDAKTPLLCNRVTKVWDLLERTFTPAFCLGTTRLGNPLHPVRLASKQKLRRFDLMRRAA